MNTVSFELLSVKILDSKIPMGLHYRDRTKFAASENLNFVTRSRNYSFRLWILPIWFWISIKLSVIWYVEKFFTQYVIFHDIGKITLKMHATILRCVLKFFYDVHVWYYEVILLCLVNSKTPMGLHYRDGTKFAASEELVNFVSRSTHTRAHIRFTALWTLSGLPGWAGTRTNLDFTEARDSEWQWHQHWRQKLPFLAIYVYQFS